jgi:hypothetical protein
MSTLQTRVIGLMFKKSTIIIFENIIFSEYVKKIFFFTIYLFIFGGCSLRKIFFENLKSFKKIIHIYIICAEAAKVLWV